MYNKKTTENSVIMAYEAVIIGRKMLADVDESVRSWFRLHLFLEANKILDLPFDARKQKIDEYPLTYRDELKEEIIRVNKLRKSP